ncbi:ABC transporter permease [Ventrimonas sp. CLA-AP-H27]|uniref:ABC transporter permease n=1 Tax=Ventrimonas faecis TaxID=3133170 RepID=A0ABV1HI68_9FIRM
MMMFLVLKERLKSFYGKYATPVNGVIKFLYSLAAMALLNGNIGYRPELTGPVALLAVALVSAFLPYGAIGCLLGAVMLAHIYAVSMETALIAAVILIILILLYYGFQPGDSFWLVLTPMAFLLKIPFAVPLLAGLSGSLLSVVPVGSGVVIYYIISYVKQNAGVLTNDASVDITQKFVQIIRGLLSSQEMVVMIMVCVVGILCVYLLHNMSLDYAWEIAIVTGTIAQLVAVFVGDFLFHVSMPVPELLIGALLSLAVALLYHFFVFTVDYTRTEYVQYEDDDYVYYVKAVPKVAVARTDVKVQRINNPARGRHDRRAGE